ncbi:hypothetical protein UA08_09338 [Talaromyces atroroseus]|uniref:Xylanolytic transcriptional activator regulatory domain-containing protein n=1 Tax=Talaromyces atroroseus TaxID=1441469 RepID=A0A1Q5Q6A5_TALAT|nr:hypothetical protein UA08_09338 [Talaromyces atroroseus]OKL55395.1 hypothetical protein UA08_09338 [Talaromyces atroroseus]
MEEIPHFQQANTVQHNDICDMGDLFYEIVTNDGSVLVVGSTGNLGVSAVIGALRSQRAVLAIVRNEASAEKLYKHVGTREGITTVETDITLDYGVQSVVDQVKAGKLSAFQHVYSAGMVHVAVEHFLGSHANPMWHAATMKKRMGNEALLETKFDKSGGGDLKEGYTIGEDINEPEELLRFVSISLDMEEDFFNKLTEFPMAALRPLHYPPQELTSEGTVIETIPTCITAERPAQYEPMPVLNWQTKKKLLMAQQKQATATSNNEYRIMDQLDENTCNNEGLEIFKAEGIPLSKLGANLTITQNYLNHQEFAIHSQPSNAGTRNSCLRRGKPEECTYSSSEQERKYAVDYRPHYGSQHARERVAHLEKLLTEMRDQMRVMERSSLEVSGILASSPEPFHDSESRLAPRNGHVADTVGKLTVTDDHAVYIGSTHWVTILEEIQILKDELSDDHSEAVRSRESTVFDAPSTDEPPATRISLLSSHPSLTKEHILAMMPPRRVVDRHVSHFFNAFDFASCILYRRKFLTEYSNFWENPSAAPIMWVGLLFSVMGISAFVQQQDVATRGLYAAETQEMIETYRTLTIHCLVAGDYLRPNRYTIETLTLHFAVDQNMNLNTDTGNWILIGVIIRLALRIGLHRDPSHWPNVRPLEAEFRRRLWITLYHMDFFTSARVGLPRIIKDSQCDTRPPVNLFEDDLSFEHNEVPPERPLTSPSPLSHIIQRHTIIKVAAEIYDATEARLPSSATIAMLDAKFERAINSIPEQSKYRSLETSIADNPTMILHRMFMDILINKAVYLLHRRSFMKGSAEEETTRSRKLCINAALMILEHQRKMSEETQPGGIMFGVRWRVASSLNHEFLQATMMLCFALSRFHEGHVGQPQSGTFHRRGEILEALTIAKSLWEKDADRSAEAHRAAKAITSVLKQDFDRSSSPILIPSDGAENTQMREQPATIDHPTGFCEQGYLDGFDSEQIMISDPPFSAIDDTVTFGSLWEDFVAEPVEGNWAGMY